MMPQLWSRADAQRARVGTLEGDAVFRQHGCGPREIAHAQGDRGHVGRLEAGQGQAAPSGFRRCHELDPLVALEMCGNGTLHAAAHLSEDALEGPAGIPGGLHDRRERLDSDSTIGMLEPFRPAQQLRGQVLDHEGTRQAGCSSLVKEDEAEARERIAFRQLEAPRELAGGRGGNPGGGRLVEARRGVIDSEGNPHQALADGQELVEMVQVAAGIHDAAQLEIIAREHDAPVARAPFEVAAARRHGEAEALIASAALGHVADGDDRVVDAADS